MADQKNPEISALMELERRMMSGDPGITPEISAKVKERLDAYRKQGLIEQVGKPLPDSAARDYSEALDIYGNLKRSTEGFLPDYGGNALTGGLENTLQGLSSSFGTPGQRDWWANFRSADNQIRNKLFGSALTPTEGQAYAGTTITERMDPKEIQANLQRRYDIVRGAMKRRYDFLKANGYSPAAIDALTGEFSQDFAAPPAAPIPDERKELPGKELSLGGGQTPPPPLEVDVGGGDFAAQTPEFQAGLTALIDRGASRDEIADYWAKNAKAAPPGVNPSTPQSPDTGTGLGAALTGAADVLTSGGIDELSAAASTVLPGPNSMWAHPSRSLTDTFDLNLQQAEGAKQDQAAARPGATMLGQLGGLALGGYATGLAAPGAASWLTSGGRGARLGKIAGLEAGLGAAYGAGSNNEDRLGGAALGAVTAPAAAMAGRATVTAASRLLSPTVKSAIKTLNDAGIRGLSPGQIGGQGGFIGRVVKGFEDRMAGLPLVGDVITSARRDTIEQLNRVAVDEALKPIGVKLPADKQIGSEAIAWAQDAASQAYEQALAPIQAQADDVLQTTMTAVNDRAIQLPKAQKELFDTIVSQDVMPFIPQDGVFSGRAIQSIKQGLDDNIASLKSGSPADRKLADVLTEAREGFMDFAFRAAPEDAAAFRAADDAYGNLVILERAAAKANQKGGVFNPSQLAMAAREADRSVRKRATAAGKARMQDLTTAASEVLPSSVPDSGTAGRGVAALMGLGGLGALGGGGLGYADSGASGATTGALAGAGLLAAPYSRAGRKTLQGLFVGERPGGIRSLGEMLERRKSIGDAFGLGLALPFMGQ